jgi:hypothetical protein
MAKSVVVSMRRIIPYIVAAVLLLAVLFDVSLDVDVAAGTTRETPDPAVEANFDRCLADKDEEIHATAFGTIDNPDVQKEFITSRRAVARQECRERFPETMITVEEPAHFHLVDLKPRFW